MNLDLPQADRWTEIVKDYKHLGPAIVKYLADAIPKWAFPIIEAIARDVRPYFHEYGEEVSCRPAARARVAARVNNYF